MKFNNTTLTVNHDDPPERTESTENKITLQEDVARFVKTIRARSSLTYPQQQCPKHLIYILRT